MSNRRRLGTIAAVILATFFSGFAWAEFKPRVALDTSANESAIVINGRNAIRFQNGNGNLSAAQRAEITVGRIQQLVNQKVDVGTIFVKGDKYQARVYAGENLICIATALDAKTACTSPVSLANSWATNIRILLSMPPLALSARELLVPLGEARSVDVRGAATGPIYASVANNEIAAVEAESSVRSIRITGRQLGKTTVEVSVEGERAALTVIVKKYAGVIPGIPSARVTGNPCPVSVISQAISRTLSRSANLEPGAKIEIGNVDPIGGPMLPDQIRMLKADVKISGDGYITYNTSAMVEVRNMIMPRDVVHQLFYSNNPERLLKYQTLFAGRLESDLSTRILYHHQNAIGKRVHFIVDVINPDKTPASFRVLRGVSNPLVDTVVVGYIAGLAFMKNHEDNVSVIENVPPQSRMILVSDTLNNMETASGILQLRQLEGTGAYVRVMAAEPYVDNVTEGMIAAAPNPIMLQLSDHVYPSPSKTLDTGYIVGTQWAFIPIGKHALDDLTSQKKLYGNYGVSYNINIKVENPTNETKNVNVLFEPSAGLASGVFIVDGKFVATKYAQPPTEYPLASYRLKPGEIRNVKIKTVPLAGSNYPATVVVRS